MVSDVFILPSFRAGELRKANTFPCDVINTSPTTQNEKVKYVLPNDRKAESLPFD